MGRHPVSRYISWALPKCKNCGKARCEHQDDTLKCPVGERHKLLGYTEFSEVSRWEGKDRYQGYDGNCQ